MGSQPAWGLGDHQQEDDEDQDGNRFRTEHPAPTGRLRKPAGKAVGDQDGQHHAGHNGQLVHEAQCASVARRCDFGDVHGRGNRTQADAQAAHNAEYVERIDVAGQGSEHGTDRQQKGSADQGSPASQTVTQPGSQERAGRAPERGAGGGEAKADVGQVELFLQKYIRSAHDGQVVAEEETAHGGHECNGEDVARSFQAAHGVFSVSSAGGRDCQALGPAGWPADTRAPSVAENLRHTPCRSALRRRLPMVFIASMYSSIPCCFKSHSRWLAWQASMRAFISMTPLVSTTVFGSTGTPNASLPSTGSA